MISRSPRITQLSTRWGGPAILFVLGIFLAALTWRVSGDILVDAGRDLYAAQQINTGRALYTDLCYLYGPLPPYVIAWIFKIFGTSIDVLRTANLILVIPIVGMIYSMLRRMSDVVTATFACSVLLVLFIFGQFTALRNYNFLTPYTNAATYGFELSITTLWALSQLAHAGASVRKSFLYAALAGGACGLSFLVKPEFFLASAVTLLAGLISIFALRISSKRAIGLVAVALACGLIAPAIVLGLIATKVPWHDLWSGTLAGYQLASDPRVTQMPIFRDGLGLASAGKNLIASMNWFSRYLAILLPAVIIAALARPSSRNRKVLPLIALLAFVIGTVILVQPELIAIGQGIPIAVLVAIIIFSIHLLKRHDVSSAERWLFSVFCLAMLARMILNARLYQYGFVSASPAVLLMILAGMSWLPRVIDSAGRLGKVVRFATMGIVLGIVILHLQVERGIILSQQVSFPGGLMGGGDKGEKISRAIAGLTTRAKPGDTLAVWPEGAAINFVTGIPNPTPYELLNPLGLIRAGGEEVVVNAYHKSPPTWVMLVHLDTAQCGLTPFGIAYARPLHDMLVNDYILEVIAGPHPFTTEQFGIALYRHK